jgi:hypothetical protein
VSDDPEDPHSHLPEPSIVEHGGRVELRLSRDSEAPGAVAYDARWFTADEQMEGRVVILSGDPPGVEIQGPQNLPGWLETFTTTLVRTTARSARKDDSWPRRLTRWRKAPKPA